MNSAVINELSNDIKEVKEKSNSDTILDLNLIIKTLAPYSTDDLVVFKDFIDIVLIYRNNL